MMRVAYVATIASLGLIASGAEAQTRPDFSGRWTTDPDPAAAAAQPAAARGRGAARGGRAGGRGRGPATPADMGSGWGSTITVEQDARQFAVEYAFFARGDMQAPLRFVFALDGSQTTNSVMMGRGIQEETSSARWDGDALVIRTSYPFTNPADGQTISTEVTRRLTLESATSLVVETTRAGVLGGQASTVRTVYRKVE